MRISVCVKKSENKIGRRRRKFLGFCVKISTPHQKFGRFLRFWTKKIEKIEISYENKYTKKKMARSAKKTFTFCMKISIPRKTSARSAELF